MTPLSKSLKQEAYESLASNVCPCGAPKSRRQSFCRACYFALQPELQIRLYHFDGYPNTWDEARTELRVIGRIK